MCLDSHLCLLLLKVVASWRRHLWCCAVICHLFTQNWALRMSPMSIVCVLPCCWATLAFGSVIYSASPCLLWAGLCPHFFQWASLGLPWAWVEPDQVFNRDAVAPNCRLLFLCYLFWSFHRWAWPVSNQMSALALCWGCYETGVLSLLLPWEGVILDWYWPLVVVLALCQQACGTAVDGLWPWTYWRVLVGRRMLGWVVWYQQGLHQCAMGVSCPGKLMPWLWWRNWVQVCC